MISWKNSFKRLNEEYELAKKKKQAVDNLYIAGKISQFTRDSFNKDISATIVEIERQQKDLLEKMQLKTDELSCQITTLESLLANYEIQYVVGEIEETAYQRDSLLLSAGIDAARNELETIKQATMQLCGPISTVQAPLPPELPVTTPTIETPAMECISTEATTPVETAIPIETPVESTLTDSPSFETAPAPITETIETQTFATETPLIEETITESAPFEESVVEEPVMESSLVEESVVESAPFEESPFVVESAPFEESVVEEPVMESSLVEESVVESAPFEESSVDEDVVANVLAEMDESAIEITATDPVFLTHESAVETSVMDYTSIEAPIETAPIIEVPLEEATIEIATEDAIAEVPLQVFEVTEQAPIEQTLEKVMEQLNSPVVETLTVEELTHDSHPSTAPHQAPSDIIVEAVSDGQIDENGEDTTK